MDKRLNRLKALFVIAAGAVVLCSLLVRPVLAYVDLAPTLAKIVADSKRIVVVEVAQFDRSACSLTLKETRALKGDVTADPVKHNVASSSGGTIPLQITQWAEPGAKAVMFVSRSTALVCVGNGWYQVRSSGDGTWKLGADRPDLPLAYYGSLSRLSDGLSQMLAGNDAVLTVVSYGADDVDTSIDLALNRTNMPGLIKVARIRANLKMPQMVMAASSNAGYVLGLGPATANDVPALVQKLQSTDATVRAEAADDLGWLNTKASAAQQPLEKLLDDSAAQVRFAAATALLRISPSNSRSVEILSTGLASADAAICRDAAQAVGRAGRSAAALTPLLSKLLSAEHDPSVRVAALQAVGTLGPSASLATPAILPLLAEADFAIDAADALGRIGPAARPIPDSLLKMLSSNQTAVRWAAVRAMSQIGGPEAHPAVEFMMAELPKAQETEAYNMLVYLALLGSDAKDAINTVRTVRVMLNPMLRPATLWAIDPDRNFPWQNEAGPMGMPGPGGGGGDGPNLARYIYEAYFHELGNRLAPTSQKLLNGIMDGTAGEVPTWGYHLLNSTPDDSVRELTSHLTADNPQLRERATVALGYMGPPAAAAKDQLTTALTKASDERERKLIEWSLREIEAR